MIAICSNTSVYVGATIFPLVRSCPFPEQYKVRRLHQQEIVRRMSCCQAARICSKGLFERMTRDTTVTAPSTMKFMVVAPPDGNIFTVGAKRFRCTEVLPTEVSPSQLYCRSEEQCRRVTSASSVQDGSFCVVATLMSLATAGRCLLPLHFQGCPPRISLTGSWIKLFCCSRALWIRTVKS